MRGQILSLTVGNRRVLTLFVSLLVGTALLFGLGLRTAETQTTPPTFYEVQDLGIIAGDETNPSRWSTAEGLNDSGEVVGFSDGSGEGIQAFLYSGEGPMQNLGALGGTYSFAHGINDSGQVVGSADTQSSYYSDTGGQPHAFLYENGQMQGLGTLEGSGTSAAYGINGSGQIVGVSDISSSEGPEWHAFLYDNANGMEDLLTLGGPTSQANDISDSGQVVGSSETSTWNEEYDFFEGHAFLYSGEGPMEDLGSLGGSFSEASGINNLGHVVGYADTANGERHAFLYENGHMMQDLGTLDEDNYSWALDINDSGQIIGFSNSGTSWRAFLYENGHMSDLNTLLMPEDSNWAIEGATSINNNGQIVGKGRNDGGPERAVLLTPSDTPPPDDTTPPQTNITSGPEGPTNDNSPTFEFTSADSTASFECRLTKEGDTPGSFEGCTSPHTYPTQSDGNYTFEVRAKDEANNEDQSPAQQSFTVDVIAPSAGSASPADAATDVALNTNAAATFSEAVDPQTLTSNNSDTDTFTLTKQGSTGSSSPPTVAARVSYDSASKKATLDPAYDLEAYTSYKATIKGGSTGVKDLAGNTLEQDYSWTFTTKAPNCTQRGTSGNDTLKGTSGKDVICGLGGNDTLQGLGGDDILIGGDGNDTLIGGAGNDILDGSLGTDTASYAPSQTAVNASLATKSATGEGSDTFVGIENITGSSKADTLAGDGEANTLTGDSGADMLRGGAGNDTVVGSGGADLLFGEDGDDTVNSKDGTKGNDSLDGGAGNDTKVTDETEKSITGFP